MTKSRRIVVKRDSNFTPHVDSKGVFSAGHPTLLQRPIQKTRDHKVDDEEEYRHPTERWEEHIRGNTKIQFTKRRTFLFLFLLLWVTLLWLGLIYKHTTSGWPIIFEYYTNITLFLQAIFYTIYLFIFFEDPDERWLEKILLTGVFWTVFVQIILVFIMVHAVLLDAPQLVTKEMKTWGGPYDDGVVLVANALVHYVPVVVVFVFVFITWSDIAECLIYVFGYFCIPEEKDEEIEEVEVQVQISVKIDDRIAYWYTTIQFVLAATPFLLYMLVVDLNEQYEISEWLAVWPPILASILISGFIVKISLYFLFHSTIPGWFVFRGDLNGFGFVITNPFPTTGTFTREPRRLYVRNAENMAIPPT